MNQTCIEKERGLSAAPLTDQLLADHCPKASDTFHFTTAQTTGAHIHAGRRSVHVHADTLRIRRPGTASFMVGMAHAVAGDNTLVANLTKLSHRSHLL